jgi:hypothetical protein
VVSTTSTLLELAAGAAKVSCRQERAAGGGGAGREEHQVHSQLGVGRGAVGVAVRASSVCEDEKTAGGALS